MVDIVEVLGVPQIDQQMIPGIAQTIALDEMIVRCNGGIAGIRACCVGRHVRH